MALQRLTIRSIDGGWSPKKYQGQNGQYLGSLGIDPDHPLTTAAGDVRTGGGITPVPMAESSDTDLSGAPMWFVTPPEIENVYVYAYDGEFLSYDSALSSGSEAVIGTPTGGVGNGAAYYNNYIYLTTNDDVARYGPLDNSPALVSDVWTGATLGSQTALKDNSAAYPSINADVNYPNHAMHAHTDNKLYFCDYDNAAGTAATAGKGMIHYVKTKSDGSDEGKANDASAYNVLDIPYGYRPMDIESYGDDIVIAATQQKGNSLRQGSSALFFWDKKSPTFYRQVPLQESVVSSLLNKNGELYAFAGSSSTIGMSMYRYLGGFSFEQEVFQEEGYAPPAGAVDHYGDRIVWGGRTTYPGNSASVFSMGSKNSRLPSKSIHNVAKAGVGGTDPFVTAVKYAQQKTASTPRVVIGSRDDADTRIEIYGGTSIDSEWRSEIFQAGKKFTIEEVRVPLAAAITSGVNIVPKLHVDNGSTVITLPTINNTNYPGKVKVEYKKEQLNALSARGEFDIFLELEITGSVIDSVIFPIEILINTLED